MQPAIAIAVLFTRFDAPALLAHERRRLIVDVVRARPGLRVGDLASALDVDYKTALHHARMLARAGLLVLEREGRARACYPPGAARAPAPFAPRVVQALVAVRAGAATPATLARALGVPRGTAGSLLDALARRGLVERDGHAYRLSGPARDALPGDEAFWRGAGLARRWSASSSAD